MSAWSPAPYAPERHQRSWRTDRLIVVLPRHHALTVRPSLGFAELDGVPFVARPPETALQKLCLHHAAADGIVLAQRVRTSGFDEVRRDPADCRRVPYAGPLRIETRRRSRLAARAFVEHLMAYGA